MGEDGDLIVRIQQAALMRGDRLLVAICAQRAAQIFDETAPLFHENSGMMLAGRYGIEHDIIARLPADPDLALLETVAACLPVRLNRMRLKQADLPTGRLQQQISPGVLNPRFPISKAAQELQAPVRQA